MYVCSGLCYVQSYSIRLVIQSQCTFSLSVNWFCSIVVLFTRSPKQANGNFNLADVLSVLSVCLFHTSIELFRYVPISNSHLHNKIKIK